MAQNIRKVPPLAQLNRTERLRYLSAFSLPIILALSSQNLLNIIDTWIVGQLGTLRLGAVALGGNVNWVLSSFFIGLGSGVQAYVSRKVGEDDIDGAVGALRRTLLFVAGCCAIRGSHVDCIERNHEPTHEARGYGNIGCSVSSCSVRRTTVSGR